jgi:uncharacterized protein with WD repeat
MTSSYKYQEPPEASHDRSAMGAGVGGDGAFIRLLSLFNENFGSLTGETDADITPAENGSMSPFWYDDMLMEDTSSGPCNVFNATCSNLTDDFFVPSESYPIWQVSETYYSDNSLLLLYVVKLSLEVVQKQLRRY